MNGDCTEHKEPVVLLDMRDLPLRYERVVGAMSRHSVLSAHLVTFINNTVGKVDQNSVDVIVSACRLASRKRRVPSSESSPSGIFEALTHLLVSRVDNSLIEFHDTLTGDSAQGRSALSWYIALYEYLLLENKYMAQQMLSDISNYEIDPHTIPLSKVHAAHNVTRSVVNIYHL